MRGEQIRGDLQARFARHGSIGQAQQLKLVSAEACGFLLLLQAKGASLLAGAEVMTGLAVGADEHFALEVFPVRAAPEFKRTGRGEFVIVEMRVDEEGFHNAPRRSRRFTPS